MIVLAFYYVTDLKKADQDQETREVTTRAGLGDEIQGSPKQSWKKSRDCDTSCIPCALKPAPTRQTSRYQVYMLMI